MKDGIARICVAMTTPDFFHTIAKLANLAAAPLKDKKEYGSIVQSFSHSVGIEDSEGGGKRLHDLLLELESVGIAPSEVKLFRALLEKLNPALGHKASNPDDNVVFCLRNESFSVCPIYCTELCAKHAIELDQAGFYGEVASHFTAFARQLEKSLS